jgi:hypothetical protein
MDAFDKKDKKPSLGLANPLLYKNLCHDPGCERGLQQPKPDQPKPPRREREL